ncbi:MAG TPA: hypothetical protein VFB74_13885 [Kribbellaceae bacterium]|nr:hypothetical protein [Kribbellaceae bacterium]
MISLCGILSLNECLTEVIQAIVEVLFSGFWAVFEFSVREIMKIAVGYIVGTIGTVWVRVDTIPIVENETTFMPSDAISFVQGRVMYLAFMAATLSLIIAGMKMALSHRGDALKEVVKSLATLMFAVLFGVMFTTLLIWVGDGLAQTFIDDVVRTKEFDQRMEDAVNGPFSDLTLPLMLLLGGCMIVSSIIQIGLMFVRNGMLILLIGVLPLAAAATNTEMGKMWFRKLIGWLFAFVVYKPVAALIYAAGFRLFTDQSGGVPGMVRVTTGVTMLIMAVVAMPALIRFVAPKAA